MLHHNVPSFQNQQINSVIEIASVCYEINTKLMNTACGHNSLLLNVKTRGTCTSSILSAYSCLVTVRGQLLVASPSANRLVFIVPE